ncbi:hypothetical protein CVT26_001077 [Gymnopilus dilepis]|uniref:Uncharacterized protein n=1 Tax=Gymnopilus dilepis TaxID=231916 RepID=A0A409Y281_9AGAR|nr:hypothetical protein CVT26_001077 [Gymnopilus dilepis]
MPRIVFKGLRKTFLEEQLEGYQKSMTDGTKDDFVNDVIRRFLKRFPLELPLDKEPSQEHLAAVDDSQPDPEIEHPVPEPGNGFQRQYEQECQKYDALLRLLETRKEQIARWLRYHHAKTHGIQKELDLADPSTIFASKLLGVALEKPRKISAFLLYQRDNAELISNLYNAAKQGLLASNGQSCASPSGNPTPGQPTENAAPVVGVTVSAGGPSTTTRNSAPAKPKAPSKPLASKSKKSRNGPGRVNIGSRGSIAQDLWLKEPEAVRKDYEARAVKAHDDAVEEWTELLNGPPSTAPEDLQACIDQIASLIQPALDTVTKYTGMKATFIMGGPEPADGGEVNVISLHSGSIRGPVKMNFAQSERVAYQSLIVPAFSAFLGKCYTKEDIQRAALPKTKSALAYLSENEVSYCDANGVSKAVSSISSASPASPASSASLSSSSSSTPGSSSTSPSSSSTPDTTSAHLSTSGTTSVPVSSSKSNSPAAGDGNASEMLKSGGPAEDANNQDASPSHGVQSGGSVMRSPSFPPPPSSPLFTPPSSPSPRSRSNKYPTTPTPAPTLSRAAPPPPSSPLAHSDATSEQAPPSSPLPPNPRIGPPKRKKGDRLPNPAVSDVATNSSTSTRAVLSDLNPQLPGTTSIKASTRKRPSNAAFSPDKPSKRRKEAQKEKENVGSVGSGQATGDASPRDATLHANVEPGPQEGSDSSSGGKKRKRKAVIRAGAAEGAGAGAGSTGTTMTSQTRKGRTASEDGPSRPKRAKIAPSLESSSTTSNNAPLPTNPSLQSVSTTQGSSTATQSSYVTALSSPSSLPTTSTPSLAHLIQEVPEDCDQSLAAALKLLTSSSLGVKFDALIAMWLRFEGAHGYKGFTKRINTVQRPSVIGDWIQRARSSTFAPVFDVEEFGTHFWTWWSNLQPTWRKITANTTAREVDGGWDALDKPGGNGWPSIVAALFFWGRRLGGARVEGVSWDIAVDDVCWVLSELHRRHVV